MRFFLIPVYGMMYSESSSNITMYFSFVLEGACTMVFRGCWVFASSSDRFLCGCLIEPDGQHSDGAVSRSSAVCRRQYDTVITRLFCFLRGA